MAILRGPPDPLEVARFKGVVHYTKDRGLHVVKTWPRKRGQKATPPQRQARADFKRMVAAVNDCRPEDKAIARDLAKGTGYTWRDILSAAVTGELLILEGVNTVQIQTELDKITNQVGAMLVRTDLGWAALPPGLAAQVLTMLAADGLPHWQDPAGGGTSGLFGPFITTPPTSVSTGFTGWYNQGTAQVSDAANGIELSIAIGGGGVHNFRARQQVVPATPYTRTWMIFGSAYGNPTGIGVGWSDGAKAHSIHFQSDGLYECKWSAFNNGAFTTISPNITLNSHGVTFFRLTDSGTTVTAQIGFTGNTWHTVFTGLKSALYLGATGYSHMAYYLDNYAQPVEATLLAFG